MGELEVKLNSTKDTLGAKKFNQAGNFNIDLSNQQGTIYDAPNNATYMGNPSINMQGSGAMTMDTGIFSDPYSIVNPNGLSTQVDTLDSITGTFPPVPTYQNGVNMTYEGYLNLSSETPLTGEPPKATYADDLKNTITSIESETVAQDFEVKTGELTLKETAKYDLFEEALGNWFTQDSKELLEEVKNMKDEDIIALADAYEKVHGGEPEALIRTIQGRIRSSSEFRPSTKRLIEAESKLIEVLSKSPRHAAAALSAGFGCIGTNDRVIDGVLTNIIEKGDIEKMAPTIAYTEAMLGKKLDKSYLEWQCFSKKGKDYLNKINAIRTGSKEYYEFAKTIDNFSASDREEASKLIDKMDEKQVIKLAYAYDVVEEKPGSLLGMLRKERVGYTINPLTAIRRSMTYYNTSLEEKIASKIASDPTQAAFGLHAAMKGIGKNTQVVDTILDKLKAAKNDENLLEVMSIYSQIDGETLSEDIQENYFGSAEKKRLQMFKELKRAL